MRKGVVRVVSRQDCGCWNVEAKTRFERRLDVHDGHASREVNVCGLCAGGVARSLGGAAASVHIEFMIPLWNNEVKDWYENELIPEFERLNPDIKVEINYVTWDEFDDKRTLAIASGIGLDVHNPEAYAKVEYRTGMVTTELSKDGLLDAVGQRRTYATYDRNLCVKHAVNGEMMGTVLDFPDVLDFTVIAYDPDDDDPDDRITRIEIVTDKGELVLAETFDAHHVTWSPSVAAGEAKYFFVLVYTADKTDGPTAYVAPVWTGWGGGFLPYADVVAGETKVAIGLEREAYELILPFGTVAVPQLELQMTGRGGDPKVRAIETAVDVQVPETLPETSVVRLFDAEGNLLHVAKIQLSVAPPSVRALLGEVELFTPEGLYVDGELTLSLSVDAPPEMIERAAIFLTPLSQGRPVEAERRNLYDGPTVPRVSVPSSNARRSTSPMGGSR